MITSPDISHKAYLLSSEIPLRFDKMVFAQREDGHIILLHDRRILSQLDQLQVDRVGIIYHRQTNNRTDEETRLKIRLS